MRPSSTTRPCSRRRSSVRWSCCSRPTSTSTATAARNGSSTSSARWTGSKPTPPASSPARSARPKCTPRCEKMLASEVIALAREYLIEARDVRFIDDPEAFRELDEEQRRLVDRIIAPDNPSYPFPPLLIHGDSDEDPTVSEGEKCQQGQSETELVEVELPEDVWRLRRVTVTYDDGSRAHVKLVPEAQAHLIPRRTPAAYL